MAKDRNDRNNIDWGAMTRNNQYKDAPSVSKQQVPEPKPAQVMREGSTGKHVDKHASGHRKNENEK